MSSCNDLSETVRAKMKLLTVYDLQKVILCEKRMGCLMFSKSCVDSDCARGKKILPKRYWRIFKLFCMTSTQVHQSNGNSGKERR